MATPITPERPRPPLGPRSQTDSSPKVPKNQAVGQHHKKHHLELFGHTLHRDKHHLYSKDKRSDDKAASKTNLRRQLSHPLSEIGSKVAPGDSSHRSSQQHSVDDLRNASITREELRREKERSKLRDQEVRNSLGRLSDTAQQNTRRLDLAYYSLLEKLRMLRSTIANLLELSTTFQEMRDGFEQDAATVKRETERQIEALNSFQKEQQGVEELEARVKASMAKAENLSARLEAARNEVDMWQTREIEWQAKTSKRLAICWWLLSSIIVLIFAIFTVKRFAYSSTDLADKVLRESSKNAWVPSFIASDLAEISSKRLAAKQTPSAFHSVSLPQDRRLEIFDEL